MTAVLGVFPLQPLRSPPTERRGGPGSAGDEDRRSRRGQRRVERGAVGLQRIERHEGGRLQPEPGKAGLDELKIAHHQRALARGEGLRAGVADEDPRRRDVAEAALARGQTELDVLVIALRVELRQGADRVEAGLGDVEAEADPVRDVDERVAVDLARQLSSAAISAAEGIGLASLRRG